MRSLKVFICLLLVLCLSVLPFMQRVHAVVTVSTVVGVLILTVLAAMGITLVVKDMQKEAFVLQKGDSFMQSNGYAGSFAEWIAGGTDVDVALKTGFLVLAKPVVDRIKQFISWLVPGATSDTIIDLGSGGAEAIGDIILSEGTFNSASNRIIFSSVGTMVLGGSQNDKSLTLGRSTIRYDGYEDKGINFYLDGGYHSSDGSFANLNNYLLSSGYPVVGVLIKMSDDFVVNGVTYKAGIYSGMQAIAGGVYPPASISSATVNLQYMVFLSSDISIPNSDGQAIIGSYDDLSQLQDSAGTDGTVNNTFYITQAGQALDPSSDDIADIIGALQQSLDDINSKLDVLPWTAETAETGQIYPDYDDFQLGDLDFSSLGALITTRFPFSIPWDVMRIFNLFVTEPEAPHWEFDLMPSDYFEGIDTEVSIDLGDYPIIGTISRWFCILDVLLGLAYVSKTWIWTA